LIEQIAPELAAELDRRRGWLVETRAFQPGRKSQQVVVAFPGFQSF
jgi:hypothetical protein